MSAKLTVGLNENGKIITIEEAAQGKKCNCFCPICKSPLIAKNKVPISLAKHDHHFAHYKDCPCKANDETVLHRWAKEVLSEEKALRLPEGNGRIQSGLIHFINVEIEKRDETYGFRPDAEATLENGEKLLIEFYVSHKVTAKKRKIIEENRLNCIEIDLNHVEIDKDAIRSFLTDEIVYKEWIGLADDKEELHQEECDIEECDDECDCDECDELINTLLRNLIPPQKAAWGNVIGKDYQIKPPKIKEDTQAKEYIPPEQRSCFMCKCNLCNYHDGWAYCGPYISLELPEQRVNPDRARDCKFFRVNRNSL